MAAHLFVCTQIMCVFVLECVFVCVFMSVCVCVCVCVCVKGDPNMLNMVAGICDFDF